MLTGSNSGVEKVAVIDLFAGPGGLGEGFAQFHDDRLRFEVALSVEKDPVAVKTLRLRKFFRNFGRRDVPEAYYDYIRNPDCDVAGLASAYPAEWKNASEGVLPLTLGSPDLDQKGLEKQIRAAIGDASTWILVGGPPCQAYSLVGRSRMRGEDPDQFMRDHRHTLYREYLRILAKFLPPLFVMENVKGLLSSKLGGVTAFEQIKKDLSDPRLALGDTASTPYTILPITQYGARDLFANEFAPSDYVVRSELHGVPQARHRVILVGVRHDLSRKAMLRSMKANEKLVSVRDAIGDLPRLRSRLSGEEDSFKAWTKVVRDAARTCQKLGLQTDGLAAWCRSTPPFANDPGLGARFQRSRRKPKVLLDWLYDERLGGVVNHEARGHIREDLARYLFVAAFAQMHGRSPTLRDFPRELLPEHKNARSRTTKDSIPFSDRFRAQRWDSPSTTVTSHISKDGHYFIHPDVVQCRALTVREAARLQTFPDNYFFEGNRTQQYHQVGNAVPPYLAFQIAKSVAEVLRASEALGDRPRRRTVV